MANRLTKINRTFAGLPTAQVAGSWRANVADEGEIRSMWCSTMVGAYATSRTPFTEIYQGTSFYRITDESRWTMRTRRAIAVLE